MTNIPFNGLDMHLGNLSRLSNALTRSISAENPTGAKGQGGMAIKGTGAIYARGLGRGWKISPFINLAANSTTVLADIEGPGAIQHIWLTVSPAFWRRLILRFYWDQEQTPSVEVPLGDFFCNGWCVPCDVNSLAIAVNPGRAFNSYWEMPFRQHARVTIENLWPDEVEDLYYQIDYTLTDIPDDRAYFHAQWRRSNPLPYMEVHTLLDGVQGQGHYVGTYIAWDARYNGWWGEGEIKFYLDGDTDWPTICGTGTEDYFCGSSCFQQPQGEYSTYSTPFSGLHQVIKHDSFCQSQQRFGMYRWHVMDPVRFQKDLRLTIQALGWCPQPGGQSRYQLLQDDIASTAFWYQTEPHAPFPELPGLRDLEVV